MPYIDAKFSEKLSAERIESLKSAFGKAIECIPGKSETWLMVNIEDCKNLYFKGDNSLGTALISVSIFGSANSDAYDKLTRELCSVVSDIADVSPDRIYITYSEFDKWGWNNMNF